MFGACANRNSELAAAEEAIDIQFRLSRDQTHNKFSAAIPPVLSRPSGAVIEVETQEATDGQIKPYSDVAVFATLDFSKVHPLTGSVYVDDPT